MESIVQAFWMGAWLPLSLMASDGKRGAGDVSNGMKKCMFRNGRLSMGGGTIIVQNSSPTALPICY